MKRNTENKVKQWMLNNASDFMEYGSLNMTMIAQTAAATFDIYDDCRSIPTSIFDIAFKVSEEI